MRNTNHPNLQNRAVKNISYLIFQSPRLCMGIFICITFILSKSYFCVMLNISQRGQIMPPSPIRKLVPFAEAAKKKGITVYHLNIGQPDIETPPQALDAVRHSDFKVLEYSHSAGNESYRRKLVQYYKKNGIDVDYNNIIITTGGSEAILFGFMSCLILAMR